MQFSSVEIVQSAGTTGAGTTVVELDTNGVEVTAPAVLVADDNVIEPYVVLTKDILAGSVDNALFTSSVHRYQVAYMSYLPRVAGSGGAATIDLTVCTGTQAPASGTTQLLAALDLVGVADTLQQATIIASPTVISPGMRVAYNLTGTLTSVVGLLTVYLKRIS